MDLLPAGSSLATALALRLGSGQFSSSRSGQGWPQPIAARYHPCTRTKRRMPVTSSQSVRYMYVLPDMPLQGGGEGRPALCTVPGRSGAPIANLEVVCPGEPKTCGNSSKDGWVVCHCGQPASVRICISIIENHLAIGMPGYYWNDGLH